MRNQLFDGIEILLQLVNNRFMSKKKYTVYLFLTIVSCLSSNVKIMINWLL